MPVLKNRAKMSTSTTGTGTITLGSAESGFQTFADAGVANGDVVRYVIEDGSNFEIGTGTYTTSGTTLTRSVSESNNSNNAINLSGSATVFISAIDEDIVGGPRGVDFDDNVKARFGNSNDLEIYHSGSGSIIEDTGNGPLHFKGSSTIDFFAGNGEYMAYMVENGAVGLYHNGSQKLNTTSTGASVTGKLTVDNSTEIDDALVSIKTSTGTVGAIRFYCESSNAHYTELKSAPHSAYSGNLSFQLPASDGSSGQFLKTDGSGNLSFAAAGGGADLYVANPVSATNPTAAGDNAVGIGDGADATGNDSIAIGTGTIAGLDSVAIGLNAASGTTTGSYNTSIGRSAAIYLTTGSNNTAVGRSALQGSNLDKVTGSGNAAIGYGAGSKNYSGNNNTYFGTDAGNAITSGSSNTFIGHNADGAATTSQQTALGYQAQTAGAEAIAIGNSRAGGIGTFAAQIGTNSSSYGAIGNGGFAIGYLSKTTTNGYAFGKSLVSSGSLSIALGSDATSSATRSISLGSSNTASHTDAVVIGSGASSSAADQITLGHTDQTVRISSAYTLPQADGTNGQVLTTNGSGAVTFADAGGGASEYTIDNKTAAYTVVSGDLGKVLNYTSGTVDVTLTALSSLSTGFHVSIWNSGTGVISIKPNSADGIGVSAGNDYDSSDPLKLEMGTGVTLVNSGTYWQIYSEKAYDYYHHSVTLGANAKASNNYAMALGNRSSASSVGAIAIGTGQGHATTASNSHAVAIGLSTASGANSVALGTSYASGSHSFAAAITTNSSSYGARQNNAVVLGQAAKSTGAGGLALGNNANVSGSYGSAIGRGTTASGAYSTALGYYTTASGTNSVSLGANSTASHEDSIVLGDTASSSAINQITLGSTSDTVRISSAYTLPTADGTNGQVLTTNGSGALSFAAAGGGGGADLYAANESSPTAQPSATGANAVAIGDQAIASGPDSFAIGEHSDATGTRTHALGFAAVATHTNALALGTSRAFAADATAISIANNSTSYGASGASSIAMGYQAKATQSYAFATGYQAQATNNSAIAMGFQAQASDGVALGYKGRATALRAFGVNNNTSGGATGNYSTAIGDSCLASGTTSVALGFGCTADAFGSVAIGRTTDVNGIRKFAYAINSLSGNYDGSSQTGIQVLSAATTDATPIALATNSTASTNNQVILPNNSAYSFSGTIIARESAAAGSDYASWEIKGALLRDANAASTVLGNGIQNKLYATSGASAWAIALSADTTNGGLKIEVTGAASTNIRWVATVNTSEVTYA